MKLIIIFNYNYFHEKFIIYMVKKQKDIEIII